MSVFERLAARRKLVNVFSLFSDYKPLIHDVTMTPGFTRYVFTIPNGMNPKLLHDKLFAFHQVLGENMTLEGTAKKFVLTVYRKKMPREVKYRPADWTEATEGMTLPIIVGVNQQGGKVAFDCAELPHVSIAGETGSGKSSLLRSILTNLILSRTPDQVELVLCDLKRSEFGLFKNLPHVRGVHIKISDVEQALMQVKIEMDRRGDLLDDAEMPHIKDLPQKLNYIIVAIDEVALLREEKELMAIVEDISSIGRSLGIILLLSMQRPDAGILSGRLKNNLVVRISGRQSNTTNATVAGVPGSENIKVTDRGRMILMAEEAVTVQTPWLSFEEAKRLLNPLKQTGRKRKEVFDAEPEPQEPQYSFGLLGGANDATK
ncbi:FtsK/SpoIIIE domain-containing protein [Domibacillus indicus]|uniref:FtsK/SpoIIIE domain-containing protein n=1 Tax=Domibacillus indicus TaxID=1437523 RepID=UPI00203F230E|nr:FtsK/SpoIIIE domain-containing protein [Domibacillus indicus]MCM3786901.1 FtsK/SpoIIIE domain-containing protein [Domibacillus indicus]